MFKAGCAEKILEIPLFAELFGYGFWDGRRNRGTKLPLFCRVFSFNDGEKRAVMVYTDTCITCDDVGPRMRREIAAKFGLDENYVSIIATHTHSAPVIGKGMYGFGIPEHSLLIQWENTVFELTAQAIADEENIAYAEAGAAPLAEKISRNRVDRVKNFTDPAIRWVRFVRPDGSCKILLHNHGAHPICDNGSARKLVSADWPGEANQMIKDAKLADMPFFMLGPCGDTNAWPTNLDTGDDSATKVLAERYINSLKDDFAKGGEKITDLKISAVCRRVEMPSVVHSPAELLDNAAQFRAINEWQEEIANRLEEMTLLSEKGENLVLSLDFQVVKLGAISFFFIPGEYFVEDGVALMQKSESSHAFIATVANDNGSYMPDRKTMEKYPDVKSHRPDVIFGFYEVHGYPIALRYKYADNVSEFAADTLLKLEKEI